METPETTALLRQFGTTKEQMTAFVEKTVQAFEQGDADPLQLKIYLKAIESIIKKIDDRTKDYQLDEARKYGGKSFDAFGAKIEVSENLGVHYNFDNTNDKVLFEAQAIVKERQDLLKTIKTSLEVVDTQTGETYSIHPAIKSSSSGLKITFR